MSIAKYIDVLNKSEARSKLPAEVANEVLRVASSRIIDEGKKQENGKDGSAHSAFLMAVDLLAVVADGDT